MFQPKSDASCLVPHRTSVLSSVMRTKVVRMTWMKSEGQLHVCMFQEKHDSVLNIVTAKQMHASLGNPKEVGDKGLLMDVDVQPIEEAVPSCEDK